MSQSRARLKSILKNGLRVLAYDAYTGLALLRERDAAVLVDVADCVSEWSKTWLRERLCTVTALGRLERAPVSL